MTLLLYELGPEYEAIVDLPLETDDEQDTCVEELSRSLEAIRGEVGPKVLALAKVVLSLDAEADLLEGHARMLLARAGSRRRRVEFLRRWLQLQMEGAEINKLKDPFVTVWLQESPAAVDVVDEANVPAEFKRVTLRLPLSLVPPGLFGLVQTCDVDRAAIHELIKRTGELPAGVQYRGRRHLRIR